MNRSLTCEPKAKVLDHLDQDVRVFCELEPLIHLPLLEFQK